MVLFDVFLIMFVAGDNYNLGLRACREASTSMYLAPSAMTTAFPKLFVLLPSSSMVGLNAAPLATLPVIQP